MRFLGTECGFKWLAVLVSLGLFLPGFAQSNEPDPAAVAFGSYPTLWGARLSPDGKRILYLRMHESDLPIAKVFDIEKRENNLILSSVKDEFDVYRCVWANNDRILCSFFSAHKDGSRIYPVTRLVGVNPDGSRMKVLMQSKLLMEGIRHQFHDRIIDLLPEDPKNVLIAMPDREGLGVSRLNIYSGRSRDQERSNSTVRHWISDGHGKVRVRMKMSKRKIRWEGRSSGSKKWKLLHEEELTDLKQYYHPVAFGESRNELLVSKRHDGKVALWAEDLSGEVPDRLIFAHPEVDISYLRMTGKHQRLVAVGYVTDRLHSHFFDEKLENIHDRLSPIFSDQEITVYDESWDGRYYLVESTSDISPGTLYRFDSEKNQLLRLFNRYPKLKETQLAPMQSLEYPARDGTLIPAYVTTPTTKEEEGPLPTVILPHGGPHSRDVWGYDWLPQFLAARGYRVLQVNYRGSSGFGEGWLGEGGFRDWRTAMDDITDGARHLVETGQADPQRMCIVGWSYGGYAALLSGIEEPDLYRCVVSIAGVSDLEDLIRERKKFTGSRRDHEYIGKDQEILKAGSPARRAKEMGAPTLLFHGDEDINVRIAQSEKMNRALKKADKEVTFIKYDEVEHSLGRNAVRIDMLDRMGEFLDTHTQPLSEPGSTSESVTSSSGSAL